MAIDTNRKSNGPPCQDFSPQIRSPAHRPLGVEKAGNSPLSPIRASWVLNGGQSAGSSGRGGNVPPISSLIEPSYLQRIRKYCSLSKEDSNNNGEDTTESSSQQKNQKGIIKKTQKKKMEAYASQATGARSDYRDHRDYKDYRDSRSDYSNINHIYGLN
mgnify:CR=1 FL=1